ncbi:hypothetical protein BDW66DRAFT_95382 [Aspergillus desertorum]
MMRPRDPRVRQTINQISHNIESANETAQEGIYTFAHNYIVPCFTSIGNCVYSCTAPCIPRREDHLRRRRRRYADFDFYDDWDNDDVEDTILGWGADELDRLLAGSGLARGSSEQPRRQRKMSYGARRASRRKSGLLIPDQRDDPTVIPSSSFLGFLERFPWRLGARGLKYRPSAADLQEHPAGLRHVHEENPLTAAEEAGIDTTNRGNGRDRSSTQSSRETANSLSSRGDLLPSDDEEDAIPLDDEFAMALTRRGTGLESDDQEGGKPESMKSASGTFSIAPTTSSKSSRKQRKKKRTRRMRSPQSSYVEVSQDMPSVSIEDLKREDEQAAREEEMEIVRKRLAARQLALSRGISIEDVRAASVSPSAGVPSEAAASADDPSKPQIAIDVHHRNTVTPEEDPLSESDSRTEPFPPLPESDEPPSQFEIDHIRDSNVPLMHVEPRPESDVGPSNSTHNDSRA